MRDIFTSASVNQLAVLLDLFPVTAIREHWSGFKGSKDEICLEIAGTRDFKNIFNFIHNNLTICKQNIYIFNNPEGFESSYKLNVEGFEISHESFENDVLSKTFLIRYKVDIILRDPLEEIIFDTILPVRFDFTEKYFLVRFVKFERDLHSLYKGRRPIQPRQTEKEAVFLKSIRAAAFSAGVELKPADLHKGVKTLWANDFMDSSKLKFKDEDSFNSKNMDGNRGVKKHNPKAYDMIKDTVLNATLFTVESTEERPSLNLTIDPSKGFISFGRYTERNGDSDYVVHQIIRHNE